MKSVHTTIPEKYHRYVTDKKLNFSKLLIKSIESEMQNDPEVLEKKIKNLDTERERLIKELQSAKVLKREKIEKHKQLSRGRLI